MLQQKQAVNISKLNTSPSNTFPLFCFVPFVQQICRFSPTHKISVKQTNKTKNIKTGSAHTTSSIMKS